MDKPLNPDNIHPQILKEVIKEDLSIDLGSICIHAYGNKVTEIELKEIGEPLE